MKYTEVWKEIFGAKRKERLSSEGILQDAIEAADATAEVISRLNKPVTASLDGILKSLKEFGVSLCGDEKEGADD
jgi:hypothetical protein